MAHNSPQFEAFVDEELQQAPLLIDQVLQAVENRLRQGGSANTSANERVFGPALRQALSTQRADLIQQFVRSLREQVASDAAPPSAVGARSGLLTLSLVDESEVTAEVELSRTVEAIASVAEYELRELRAYTSALVGDMDVARDTNPFRPEIYARALWAAANTMTLSRGFQVSFMREAAMPLAQALRLSYAAATTRLEDAGIEPGSYRTIILPAGSRTSRRSDREETSMPAALNELRDSMPVPLDEPSGAPAPPLEEVLLEPDELLRLELGEASVETQSEALAVRRKRLLHSSASRVDQQLIELLSRIFDGILTDRRLAPSVQVLLSRLHSCALRVALRDPSMLDSYEHPVWRFMDHIAFAAAVRPHENDPARQQILSYAHGLIDNMVHEPIQDAPRFQWALERIAALERHLFERHRQRAANEIASLRSVDAADDTTEPASTSVPLEAATLDTVPADLLDTSSTLAAARLEPTGWLRTHEPADWVRLFLGGQWQVAQLVWRSDDRMLWLYVETFSGQTWALRQAAIERLHAEGLLFIVRPHSLVERAAELVLRQVAPGGAGE